MLLRVVAPHFVAGATWIKINGVWRCDPKQTAPILRWMAGKDAKFVREWLKKKQYEYQWIEDE